ncbi:citrate/2-methylcitrate synthase, partial [Zavarzinia sp.]|uniref:citrate/2-methylcitrate synthase n=1 Tax=Zavarzinia sp. TaxID=2027920 RepID=UPI003567B1F6
MKTWLDRDEALALLRVKPQTLYAYVSRGQVRMEPDPADSRRSLYHAEDIAGLAGRRARGRKPAAIAASALAWGEPALPTGISTVQRGRLIYRGHDAVELARSATLVEVAQLLWSAPRPIRFPESATPAGDVFTTVADLAATGEPLLGRGGDALFRDGETLVGAIAGFCGAGPGVDAIHHRLARGWGCGEAAAERLRLALVLMADHELNASTFATRVAA